MHLVSASNRAVTATAIAVVFTLTAMAPASARVPDLERLQRAFDMDRNEASLVNDFISNSSAGKPQRKQIEIDQLVLQVRLLTPLNSDLNQPGDLVKALVTATPEGPAGKLLPAGTVLEGFVEQTVKTARLNKDGKIYFTFYWARVNGQRFGLRLGNDTNHGAWKPGPRPPETRKQKLRRVLILTSSLAIPMAVGTGGLSLAISAGAGAVIGGLLADDKHYFKGIMSGAMQGSGLSLLQPLITRGQSVKLAWGAPLQLRLFDRISAEEPATAAMPETIESLNASRLPPESDTENLDDELETKAEMLEEDRFIWTDKPVLSGHATVSLDESDPLCQVRQYMQESNLACALQAANEALAKFPQDKRVRATREALFNWASGTGAYPQIAP